MRGEAWVTVVTLERGAGQRLFGYALHLGVDPARAADLVQETLLRLWRELGMGTIIATPEAWAYRTMSRLAMDEHRLRRRLAALARRLAERPAPRVTEIDATERVAVWAQV
jgi:DNA-directed RNA polymerase specialized sigma24 family protein